MKLKVVMMLIAVLVLIGGGIMLFKNRSKKIKEDELNIENIKSFYFTYTNGYMINAYTRYHLSFEDNKYLVEIKPYGVSEEDKLETEVEKDVLEKIVNILKKYQVNKWNGFNKSDHGVMDGDSFNLSVNFLNDKAVSASGYMRWPNDYRNVRDEISDIFMEIYNKEKGNIENGKI